MTTGNSKPERLWAGDYGEAWTDDNDRGVSEIDELYTKWFGTSRLSLLERFVGDMDQDARILEVGANTGTQLLCLKELGYGHLYGIDIQREAIDRAHQRRPELDIIEGNVFDIPFKDDYFDLTFTNGMLIHVPPDRIDDGMDEIVRCSSDRIYGHEYYAEKYTEITHRGKEGVLWKTDFPSRYLDGRELELLDIEYLEYDDSQNVDVEFSLQCL